MRKEELFELLEVGRIDVRNGAKVKACILPRQPVVALRGAGGGRGGFRAGTGNEEIDDMLAAAVYEGGYSFAVEHVEAAAYQRKSIVGKIADRGREIHCSVKPGFYGVLVGRFHVGPMALLERAEVRIERRGDHGGLLRWSVETIKKLPTKCRKEQKRCGKGEPAPGAEIDGARPVAFAGDDGEAFRAADHPQVDGRSEERRVGKEC